MIRWISVREDLKENMKSKGYGQEGSAANGTIVKMKAALRESSPNHTFDKDSLSPIPPTNRWWDFH